MPPISAEELASKKSAHWIAVHGQVIDVSDFLADHPGGAKILANACGRDASEEFDAFHSKSTLKKFVKPEWVKGTLQKASL
jgi:L-lactate dehydrogenase (cytochrome)